jgi:hypothetical protein
MKTITLKNGTQEPYSLVAIVTISLKMLIMEDPICFYELVMKCRDHNHEFFGNTSLRLGQLGLTDDAGNVSRQIRNIVLSSVEGDGLDMRLGSPIAADSN